MNSTQTNQCPEQRGELSKDIIFDILRNQRRRYVLKYLNQNRGHGTLSEAAEWVAGQENQVEEGVPSSKQRKRVYVSLYQTHLPRMDDANVIEFERDRGDIDLCEPAVDLFEYLDLPDEDDCKKDEPAFEYSDDLRRSIYVRPESWQKLEDTYSFEVKKRLRQRGIRSLANREMNDAIVRLAADRPKELARHILSARGVEPLNIS